MEGPFKERDWKYLRRIHDDMLHTFCTQINRQAAEIASTAGEGPHKQYLALYRFIQESNDTITRCFDDWRRSTIPWKAVHLRRHGILTDALVRELSPEAQDWLQMVENLGDT